MVHLMGAKNGAFDLSQIVHAMHYNESYWVTLVSRIDKIMGLYCRISSLLQVSFAKETYNFIDLTNRSHPFALDQPLMQPIPLGVTFSMVFQISKLKARESLFTETWPKETFKL